MFNKKEIKREYIFEEMSPTKAVLTLAVPTIINQLVNVVYNLADTLYIGKLNNPSMVAALSVTAPLMIFLTAIANLFVVGGCAQISKSLGEKNIEKAKRLALLCPILALCAGVILTFLFIVFLEAAAIYAGATSTCMEYTKEYMFYVLGLNAIPSILSVTLGAGLRGRGYSKYEMFGITMGNILNMILDPIFIFGFNMAVKGAALATFISTCCSLIYFLVIAQVMQKKENLYCPYKEFKFDFELVKDVVSNGFPAMLHQVLGSWANTLFMNCLNVYSDAAIAGMGIVRKLEHVFGQVVMGLNQGVIPLISYNYGFKNYRRLKIVKDKTLIIGTIFGLMCAALLLPNTRFFVSLFIKDSTTIEYGIRFLKVFAFCPLSMNFNNHFRTAFQALGYKKESSIISICRNFFGYLIILYGLNYLFGLDGLIWVTIAVDMLADIVAFIFNSKVMNKVKAEMEV